MKNDTEIKIRCSKSFRSNLKAMAASEGLTYVNLITKIMDAYNYDHSFFNPILNPKLIYAVEKGKQDLVEELLREGACVNASDHNAKSALMFAVSTGNTEMVELLIKKKPNVNAQDRWGKTALTYAIDYGDQKIVELLKNYKNASVRNDALSKIIGEYKNYPSFIGMELKRGTYKSKNNEIQQIINTALKNVATKKEIKEILEQEPTKEDIYGIYLPAIHTMDKDDYIKNRMKEEGCVIYDKDLHNVEVYFCGKWYQSKW